MNWAAIVHYVRLFLHMVHTQTDRMTLVQWPLSWPLAARNFFSMELSISVLGGSALSHNILWWSESPLDPEFLVCPESGVFNRKLPRHKGNIIILGTFFFEDMSHLLQGRSPKASGSYLQKRWAKYDEIARVPSQYLSNIHNVLWRNIKKSEPNTKISHIWLINLGRIWKIWAKYEKIWARNGKSEPNMEKSHIWLRFLGFQDFGSVK